MIDNVCLLINGTLNRRQLSELVPKVKFVISYLKKASTVNWPLIFKFEIVGEF